MGKYYLAYRICLQLSKNICWMRPRDTPQRKTPSCTAQYGTPRSNPSPSFPGVSLPSLPPWICSAHSKEHQPDLKPQVLPAHWLPSLSRSSSGPLTWKQDSLRPSVHLSCSVFLPHRVSPRMGKGPTAPVNARLSLPSASGLCRPCSWHSLGSLLRASFPPGRLIVFLEPVT